LATLALSGYWPSFMRSVALNRACWLLGTGVVGALGTTPAVATAQPSPAAPAETPVETPVETPTPAVDPPAAHAPEAADGDEAATEAEGRADAPAEVPAGPPVRRGPGILGPPVQFEASLEGALGTLIGPTELSGFGRARLGATFVVDPSDPRVSPVFITLGATYEASDLTPASVGIQAELTHLGSGFWFQGGALMDVANPAPGFMLAVGLSVVGIEMQAREHDERDENVLAVYGKLRLPISMIVRAVLQDR
jgi:hypothetical protein